MSQIAKTEEDWNWLKLGFFITVQPNSFSKLIPDACNVKNNAQETYLFALDLWFCHLHVSSLLTLLKFYGDWGRVTGKIKQNELDCRDTARLMEVQLEDTKTIRYIHTIAISCMNFCSTKSVPQATIFTSSVSSSTMI